VLDISADLVAASRGRLAVRGRKQHPRRPIGRQGWFTTPWPNPAAHSSAQEIFVRRDTREGIFAENDNETGWEIGTTRAELSLYQKSHYLLSVHHSGACIGVSYTSSTPLGQSERKFHLVKRFFEENRLIKLKIFENLIFDL
jgi:hypothetical protein